MDIVPYIEIIQPEDGSNVGTEETLVVFAEGINLRNPTFSVEGEHMGFAGPLTGCFFESTTDEESAENEIMRMHCKQQLNLQSFENQKIKVSVNVDENSNQLTNSVGLYVSGDHT